MVIYYLIVMLGNEIKLIYEIRKWTTPMTIFKPTP